MEKTIFLGLLAGGIAKALISTAAGILVAVPANCASNYVCVRVASIDCEEAQEVAEARLQVIGRFPLKRRLSQLPTFGLVAALGLSILVIAYTPYFDPPRAKGLVVNLVSAQCVDDANNRKLILHITNSSKFFLNAEEEDLRSLPSRLSEIYRSRENRQLDLLADDEVSFQTVVDVIDIVGNTGGSKSAEALNIAVRLITPATIQFGCVSIPLRFVPIHTARRSWR
jgi:biopolymer transport protein ExbD